LRNGTIASRPVRNGCHGSWLPATLRRAAQVVLFAFVLMAVACVETGDREPGSSSGAEVTPPKDRAVILQGVCSSTAEVPGSGHWVGNAKRVLADEFGFRDMPTGHPQDEIIEFGYSEDGWASAYEPPDTLGPIDEASASLRDLYLNYPGSRFYLLGHSLGGVVALDSLTRHGNPANGMIDNTGGVLTVSSPVTGLAQANIQIAGAAIELLACGQALSSDLSPIWNDLAEDSAAITSIHERNWSDVRIVNIGNFKDRVVSVRTAVMPTLFDTACYEFGRDGLLQLNHDSLLADEASARELIGILLGTEEPPGGC